MVTLGERSTAISSVLLVRDDGSILVGAPADRRAVDSPGRVARHFKRRLGDTVPLSLGSSLFPAHVLMGKLLRWVLDRIQEVEGGSPEGLSVTHPANWGPFKLEHLDQALSYAGVPEALTISEPEAAAIHYATQERVRVGSSVAVYDLGGGTFDAAVLRKDDVGFSVVGRPQGIEQLGGIDFDQVVFEHVRSSLGTRLDDLDPDRPDAVEGLHDLRTASETAKIDLSTSAETTIPVNLPGIRERVRLTRVEFEAAIRPMVADTIVSLTRAIESAGLEPEDLTAVLLVGGSSRIPLVAQMVTEELGRPTAVDADPKNTIALGAAHHAAVSTDRPADEGREESPASTAVPADGERAPSRMPWLVGFAAALAVVLAVMLWPDRSPDPGPEPTAIGTTTTAPTTTATTTQTTSTATDLPPPAIEGVLAEFPEVREGPFLVERAWRVTPGGIELVGLVQLTPAEDSAAGGVHRELVPPLAVSDSLSIEWVPEPNAIANNVGSFSINLAPEEVLLIEFRAPLGGDTSIDEAEVLAWFEDWKPDQESLNAVLGDFEEIAEPVVGPG